MLNKKIFVLTILFVLIASLGIISATDLQNNDTATIADHSSTTNDYTIQADNTKSDTIKTEKQIKKQNIETNKKEKETKSVTNYEQLYYNLTDPTTDDLTISLEGTDEEYVITKNITVNEAIKNLKIDGNGKIIDGQNNYQFLIINHECNLTLNNITIQNCLADQEGLVFQIATEGGAIHQKGGNLNINNSQFLSNEAFTFGGAIYYNSSNENNVVNIFHSTFDSNRANDGGALFISHTGNITIDDSTITNNKALTGSALTILNEYAFEVNDIVPGESEPSFELLESSTNVTINNSIIDSNGYVDDTKIDYDTLYHDAYTRVGAVVIELVDKITIQNSKFNNNIAEMGGALAVAYNNELLIDNSTFDSNGIPTEYYKYDVPSQGGALYLMTNGTTKITYTNFTNNTATEGSAIYYKEMEIPNNNVEPVEVEPGRGIEIQESIPSLTINNSIIDSNGYIVENPIAQDGDEKYYCSETGAITIEGIKQISVQNSKFKNNIGRDGGAILADDYDDLLIDNSTFDSNGIPKEYYKYGLTSEGGALLLRTNGTTKITYTNLTNNTASGGSAIYCEYYEPVAPVEPGEVVSRGTKIHESTSSLLINHSIIDSNGYIDESLIDQYQNGLYPCSEAGAITIEGIKQISVLNSTFENNIGLEGEAIIAMDYDDLLISDSSFDNNSLPLEYIDYELFAEAGAVGLFPNGNTTITASNFTNNGAAAGSAIFCMGLNEECNFNISDSLFESNIGLMGGTLYLQNLNASVTNSNFTNNTVFLYENSFIGNIGLVIYSKDTTLFINTTNFIGNGLPENLTEDDVEEILTGSGIVFCQGENDVTIDNSNFQSNRGLGLGGIISFVGTYKEYPSTQQEISPKLSAIDYVPKEKDYQYGDEIQYHTNSTLRINNTKFEDNTITCNAEKTEEGNYVMPTMGYVIVTQGNTIIDNSDFINNKVINLFENSNEMENEFYYSTGPILFYKEDYNITCNVTNSNFMFNSPANFIGKDNRIILNHTTHIGTDIVMDDGYIPDFGDVMIYVDGSNQGTYYQLVSDNNDVYVKDLTLSDEYLIKMVVNQTSQSKYYANQTFNNNTYYFRIPQEFILSVNATSPITIDDDTTIKGQLYFTKNNGDKYVFPDEDVYLYINGTYVAKTKTNATGNYEFTYTTTSVGSQEVLVTVNTSPTLPTITNTTTFDVIKRDSIINIDVKNITVGQKKQDNNYSYKHQKQKNQ
jgi:hypothetical protein